MVNWELLSTFTCLSFRISEDEKMRYRLFVKRWNHCNTDVKNWFLKLDKKEIKKLMSVKSFECRYRVIKFFIHLFILVGSSIFQKYDISFCFIFCRCWLRKKLKWWKSNYKKKLKVPLKWFMLYYIIMKIFFVKKLFGTYCFKLRLYLFFYIENWRARTRSGALSEWIQSSSIWLLISQVWIWTWTGECKFAELIFFLIVYFISNIKPLL